MERGKAREKVLRQSLFAGTFSNPSNQQKGRSVLVRISSGADDLCAITSYYNPLGYRTKLSNYETFRANLCPDLRLITIECAFGDSDFVLGREDCIRVRASDVLWQKEKLLNMAAFGLPAKYKKIAWLDCDLIFEDPNWPQATSRVLEQAVVVQPFSSVVRLPQGSVRDEGSNERWSSFAAVYERMPNFMVKGRFDEHGHTGFAWAARRELFDQAGLYECCVAGSGDHVMAHAFCGDWDSACLERMLGRNTALANHFHLWCNRMYPLVRARLKTVPGSVLHLWHGETRERRYVQRNLELVEMDFNPERELAEDAGGCWQWSGVRADKFRSWARSYFMARNEDGESGRESRAARAGIQEK